MSIINGIRTVNNLLAGSLTSGQLETYLATGSNKAGFMQAMQARSQVLAIVASPPALNLVLASATAMNALAASSTAMNAVAASSSAMNEVAASSTAMSTLAASSSAKMAIFNNDTALVAIAASATAMAAMRGAGAQYSVQTHSASGAAVTIPNLNAAGSYILLGYSKSSAVSQGINLVSTRRTGSAQPNSFAAITFALSTLGADVNVATPLVAPFTVQHSTSNGYTWYYGLLRCDI